MISAILLMGPTASGKTALALRLAEDLPIEIISVDSALVYKEMNIGTAKPSEYEQQLVRHYLIDILTPLESYSVANFIDDSVRLIYDINSRGKIPVLVGGTMLYYNALLKGLSILPKSDAGVRLQIESEAANSSWEQLYMKLAQIDMTTAQKIKPNDKQRISRALEIYYLTGKPMSVLQSESNIKKSDGINFLPLAILPANRDILYERINQRLGKMLENGFIEEVKALRLKYQALTINHTSMRCVGYYQVWQYLDGMLDKQQLSNTAAAATRQLAKRQITWLRSMELINLEAGNLDLDILYTNLFNTVKSWV